MIITIVLGIVFLLSVVNIGLIVHKRKAIGSAPTKYDIEYTRQKELEIWGYYWTPEPEKKAVSAAAPIEQLNARVRELRSASEANDIHPLLVYANNPVRRFNCHRCNKDMLTRHPDRDTCQNCTLEIIQKRKVEREKAKYQRPVEEYHVMVDQQEKPVLTIGTERGYK